MFHAYRYVPCSVTPLGITIVVFVLNAYCPGGTNTVVISHIVNTNSRYM